MDKEHIAVVFKMQEGADAEACRFEMERKGLALLWEEEVPGDGVSLFCLDPLNRKEKELLFLFPFAASCRKVPLPPVDWETQWQNHAHYFQDGQFKLPIKGCHLLLNPGPGFGDLSHATTRLVLRMMEEGLAHEFVLDMGSGSGILSMAAAYLGAKRVWGVDIDPYAVEHSQKNARLNALEERVAFSLPDNLPPTHAPLTLLMNMIFSEQRAAWESIARVHPFIKEAIVSGIRLDAKEEYLEWAVKRGWELAGHGSEEGWAAFRFHCQ